MEMDYCVAHNIKFFIPALIAGIDVYLIAINQNEK